MIAFVLAILTDIKGIIVVYGTIPTKGRHGDIQK